MGTILLHSLWIYALAYCWMAWKRPSLKTTYSVLTMVTISWLSMGAFMIYLEPSADWVITNSVALNDSFNWVWLYAAGFLIQSLRYSHSVYRVLSIRRHANSTGSHKVTAIFNRILKQLDKVGLTQIRFSTEIEVPMVIGILKPCIIYPIGLVNHLDEEQTEAVLLHEIQHILNQDFLWNLMICALEIILFFNPFIYFIHRLIEEMRELEADRSAAEHQGTPLILARTLVAIEQFAQTPRMAVGAQPKTGQLTSRVHDLIGRPSPREPQPFKSFLALAVFFGAMSFSFISDKSADMGEDYSAMRFYADSLFLPDYHKEIKSIEFKTSYGQIRDLTINEEPVDQMTHRQKKALEKKTNPVQGVENNRRYDYEAGLLKKFEKNERIRNQKSNEEEGEITLSQHVNYVDLALIEGYQYGKSKVDLLEEEWVQAGYDSYIEEEEDRTQSIFMHMKTLEGGKHLEIEFNQELFFIISLLKAELSLQDGIQQILQFYVDPEISTYELMIIGEEMFLEGEKLNVHVTDLIQKYMQGRTDETTESRFFKIIKK